MSKVNYNEPTNDAQKPIDVRNQRNINKVLNNNMPGLRINQGTAKDSKDVASLLKTAETVTIEISTKKTTDKPEEENIKGDKTNTQHKSINKKEQAKTRKHKKYKKTET